MKYKLEITTALEYSDFDTLNQDLKMLDENHKLQLEGDESDWMYGKKYTNKKGDMFFVVKRVDNSNIVEELFNE